MSKVFLFSFTAMANPTLVAVTTVMLLLPNPKKLMLAYLIGAWFMSITLGIVIVFAEEKSGVVQSGKQTINPAVDFALGALLLAIAAVLAGGRDKPVRERRTQRKREKRKEPKQPRWQQVLAKGDPRIAVAVGAVLTLPGASYLAALTTIAKLDYGATTSILLVLMVNVIMLALLEAPLVCFVVAPDWTPRAIDRVKAAFARNGRKIIVIGGGVLGSLLILRAVITLLSS